MSSDRLAYADPDTSAVMARDASACRAEAHLARALDARTSTRRSVEQAPSTLLPAAPRGAGRTPVTVTEATTQSAARFAARLFD